MCNIQYKLTMLCRRGGREFYHVYPDKSIGVLPHNHKDLKVLISHPKYSVISFPDCNVTVFASGRMLIENLPEDSEKRAHAIVREIISVWCQSGNTPTHP